jgi:metallophosphoesterase (TIGR00282 family)
MKILFFGDIVGKVGRKALQAMLPQLRKQYKADIVLANVENLAHGKSITRTTLQEVLDAGVDIGTGGDHILAKPEAEEMFKEETWPIVRPWNMAEDAPGQGEKTFQVGQKKVTVINLLGEFGMNFQPVESPFHVMERWLKAPHEPTDAIIVDLHAEATSEKVNMGWLLDGHVALVVGTHTHVPTADARILPKGTGYITDLGMVGLRDGSLGVDKDQALERFRSGGRTPFDIPENGLVGISGIVATIQNNKTTHIEHIYHEVTI